MAVNRYDAPLGELAEDLARDRLDPLDLVETLCDRADELDDDLKALVREDDRRGRLREAASDVVDRHPEPDERPPLFGVPVGVKDIIHVDGLVTRAGTALPPEFFAGPEASCVTRLREAGALVFAKTVTTEFAGAGPGQTRNPHHLDHTPGGSSSGSAAGVAAGLFPLALGTQTGGSVIRPAAFCGVVGMKPSFRRIPRDGVLERSVSADHVGMFTQDLAGMGLAAAVLCDGWRDDVSVPDRHPRIAVPEGPYLDQATEEGRAAFKEQLAALEDAGCVIERVQVPTFEAIEELHRRHNRMTDAELAFVHEEWYDEYKAFYRTRMAERIGEGRAVPAGALARSRRSRLELRAELEELLDERDLDLWASPAALGPAPETIRTTGDPAMNRPWTHAGVPVVTLPAGTTGKGLPVGLQLAGRFEADERLLAWAEIIEAAL